MNRYEQSARLARRLAEEIGHYTWPIEPNHAFILLGRKKIWSEGDTRDTDLAIWRQIEYAKANLQHGDLERQADELLGAVSSGIQ